MGSEHSAWVRTLADAGSAGLVGAGLLGVPVTAWLGPHLAMGLAIWSGATTEPTLPQAGFPWLLLAAGLAAWGTGLRLKGRGGGAILLTQGGAILVALLPWIHLWRLWRLTS